MSSAFVDTSVSALSHGRYRALTLGGVVLIMVTLPIWGSGTLVDILTLALLYGYLSSAWNIIGGFGGQLSVGHAAFFGLGAYGVAILYAQFGISPYIGILVGLGVSVGAAVLLGYLAFWLPFAGYTFLLLTLGCAELLRTIFRSTEVTGGADGLIFPYNPSWGNLQFKESEPYYFIVLAMVAGIVIFTRWLRNRKLGLLLESVRDDEGAAVALGIPGAKLKLKAFVLSAAFTSLGGSFYAAMFSFITPDQVFSLDFSVAMITGALIGGRGTVWGPIVGGTLLWTLTELFVRLPLGSNFGANGAVMLYGLAIVLIVHRLPRGVGPGVSGEYVRGRLEGGTLVAKLSETKAKWFGNK